MDDSNLFSRYLIIIFGALAFCFCFFLAFVSGNELSISLLKASVACLLSGWGAKYFVYVCSMSFKNHLDQAKQTDSSNEAKSDHKESTTP